MGGRRVEWERCTGWGGLTSQVTVEVYKLDGPKEEVMMLEGVGRPGKAGMQPERQLQE